MRIVTLAAATAAFIGSTVLAFAVTDTGTITKIEWSTGTITLDNGAVYVVPPSILATTTVSVGDKVKVNYDDKIVTSVAKAT
jgi:small-conductance mechanosensitive channel